MALVEKQLISVDWDVRTLRVVHFSLRPKGGIRVRKVLSVAVPADVNVTDPASLGRVLRDVLAREGIGARRMVVDVPRDQAVLNTLSLPVVPDDDLPAVVEFQVARELPFPLADAVTDFAITGPGEADNTQDVLVAAVRHDVLDYYKRTAEAAGLTLERVGLRPYANKVAVNELLGGTHHERVLIVDVGPALTEIDVLRDGRLAFSRAASVLVPATAPEEERPRETAGVTLDLDISLSLDGATAETDEVVQTLFREVALTIEAYRAGDPGADMDHVVVAGDTGVEDALLETVRKRFGVNGERYNPTPCFGWDGESGAAAGGFAAALGLATGHGAEDRLHFDFMHPKKAVPASRRRLKKVPLVAAVLVVFAAAVVIAYQRGVGPEKQEVAALEEQIADLRAELREYEKLKFGDLINQVREFEEGQIIWLDALVDFLSAFPDREQIVISHIDLSQSDETIKLKMECKDRAIADEAVILLQAFKRPGEEESRFDARLGTTTDQQDQDDYTVQASMDVQLVNRGG
jgi:type IV pilus assembly protein PilM